MIRGPGGLVSSAHSQTFNVPEAKDVLRCGRSKNITVPLVGHVGKQGWQKGFKLVSWLGSRIHWLRSFKRHYLMTTAGRWPWKPASAKKCVTAYQPNEVVLKMNEAKPVRPYRTGTQIRRRKKGAYPWLSWANE